MTGPSPPPLLWQEITVYSLCIFLILQVFDLLGDTAVPGSGVVGLRSSSDRVWTEMQHYYIMFGFDYYTPKVWKDVHSRSN